jgi:hypothetical protein
MIAPETDDLIERLRNYAKDWRDRAASKEIVEEAAAEIERLRVLVEQIKETNQKQL